MIRRLLLVVALVAIAGCSTNDPSSAPTPGRTALVAATATAAPLATIGPPPVETPDDASPVTIDSSLLDLLPEKIGSVPVQEDADAAAEAVSDPALEQIASGVDSAVAVDTGNGDLVLANIVRLLPGAFNSGLYRQWRDSYDEGACAASGGVGGHAEAQIAGRQTYVTSCVGSMHTYHVWLDSLGILISASSIGDNRFGEQLLNGLRLPG